MATLCPSTLAVLALCTVAHAALPNFVLMMSDDTGWGDMGYNNGTADTPNLDEWAAAEGAVRIYYN